MNHEQFEVNLNDDEWMDVKAREEILQDELTQVKATLAMRNRELEESVSLRLKQEENANTRIEGLVALVEELRDQSSVQMAVNLATEDSLKKELWETEIVAKERETEMMAHVGDLEKEAKVAQQRIASLESMVQELKQEKEATRQHIVQLKAESQQHANQLGKSLSQRERELQDTRDKVKNMTKVDQQLRGDTANLNKIIKERDQAIAAGKKKALDDKSVYDALLKELVLYKERSELRALELKKAKGSTQTIALLAEDLKAQKNSLERSLQQQKASLATAMSKLAESGARETALKAQLDEQKFASEQNALELEVAKDSKQKELNDARELIETLVKLVAELKEKTASLEATCNELKEAATERDEASTSTVKELKESRDREESLRQELARVKKAAEERLASLRGILGVEEKPKPFAQKVFEIFDYYYNVQQRLRYS